MSDLQVSIESGTRGGDCVTVEVVHSHECLPVERYESFADVPVQCPVAYLVVGAFTATLSILVSS